VQVCRCPGVQVSRRKIYSQANKYKGRCAGEQANDLLSDKRLSLSQRLSRKVCRCAGVQDVQAKDLLSDKQIQGHVCRCAGVQTSMADGLQLVFTLVRACHSFGSLGIKLLGFL
jgi:aerobic-type carbon monoxide dehydrogenase small subunit (CoxS/CutS family)